MNKKNLKRVIALIEAAPAERTHMLTYQSRSDCGTAYCIGGWAALDAISLGDAGHDEIPVIASRHLGITWDEAAKLFVGKGTEAKKPQVLLTLKHLLNTGKIDWEIKEIGQPKHQATIDKLLADALRGEEIKQREDCLMEEN